MNYNLTISKKMDDELTQLSEYLGVSKATILARAFKLYKHAVNADEIILKKSESVTKVIVK